MLTNFFKKNSWKNIQNVLERDRVNFIYIISMHAIMIMFCIWESSQPFEGE